MARPKALLLARRGRLLAVLVELVLVGSVAFFARHWVRHARALHTARAQSQRDCAPGTPNACPAGATCEVVQGVGRCAGDFEDAQSLWQEAHSWVGRRVVVRHARIVPDMEEYSCTLMACELNTCCNFCKGTAELENTGFLELAGVDCLGNECEDPECGISEARSFWLLNGDVELHGRVRDNGGTLSIDEISVNGHVAPKRDIYGRPLD